MKFIAANRERWGVEPISRVLQFAPATYYAAGTRPASARAIRDQELTPQIQRVWNENFGVYGADKVWAQMRREGFLVARCTVERLMRELGLRGVVQGKTTRTTVAADGTDRPADLVDRHVVAAAPNRLWVADLTYVKTHSGWVYLAFIGDVFSRYVVGWQVSRSLRTDLALDALEMAIWGRRGEQLQGLVHHSDRGVQGRFNGWSQRPDERSCDGRAQAAPGRSGVSPADVVTWPTPGGTAGGSAEVLGGDRAWPRKRGCRCGGWRVAGGWGAVVPREWRHAVTPSDPAIGALPVVRRA